jgi:hypothetical protein
MTVGYKTQNLLSREPESTKYWTELYLKNIQNRLSKWNRQLNLSDAEIEVGVELVDHALVLDYLGIQKEQLMKTRGSDNAIQAPNWI